MKYMVSLLIHVLYQSKLIVLAGPVVRINPHELHVSDPDFYDVLYGGKRDKYPWSTDVMEVRGAMFTTVEHDLHRRRRAPLAPFFSASAIRRYETPMYELHVRHTLTSYTDI
jgi:hypothetical protein